MAGPLYPALAAMLSALEPITVWGFAYCYPPEEESDAAPAPAEIARRLDDIEALKHAASMAVRGTV